MKRSGALSDFLADEERCRVSSPGIREALTESLSRIPDSVYNNLVHGDRPLYVAESSRIAGVVTLDCEGGSGVILLTLNEGLRERPLGEIVGIIVHELAHLALGHRFVSWEAKRKGRLREEYEADALACQWGFQQELMAALGSGGQEARGRREKVS